MKQNFDKLPNMSGNSAHLNDLLVGTSQGGSQGFDFSILYGAQVAREVELIERIIVEVSKELGHSLREGDLDAFCRTRQSKLTIHQLQGSDEDFERVRLLAMLYEGVLRFLNNSQRYYADQERLSEGDRNIQKALKILQYLKETLNAVQSSDIAHKLEQLYDFCTAHLIEAEQGRDIAKVNSVYRVVEQIYMGFLEIEIRRDLVAFLGSQNAAEGGELRPT